MSLNPSISLLRARNVLCSVLNTWVMVACVKAIRSSWYWFEERDQTVARVKTGVMLVNGAGGVQKQ